MWDILGGLLLVVCHPKRFHDGWMKTRGPRVPPCDPGASVQLTHDHDVDVGQQTAVEVGGFTLVDSRVVRSSVMEHHGVIQHPPVLLWVIW